ncbi:hypothetical protein N2152v2_008685 [Parachlorella kessleri]
MEPLNTSFFANPDDTKATPLHWAALRGNLGEVQALLAAEPKGVARTDSHGWTALHWAAGAGQAECASALMRAGASLEARASETDTPWVAQLAKGFLFDSPACHAKVDDLAAAGFVEEARSLREEMARPDAKATAGATPLHVAAGMGAVNCICCLMQLGAQLEAANSLGLTALHLAAACNHVPALQELVQAGADVRASDSKSNTPLHLAAGLDSLECLRELIRLGASIIARGDKRCTSLHVAAAQGATACVKQLLAAGADMEAVADCGLGPLHLAAWAGMLEALGVLIDAGADVHATDEHGHTPLHPAAAAGRVEAGLALLAAGADLEAATTESATPIQLAAGRGNAAMISALAASGADINRRSGNGLTCLHVLLARACMGYVPEAPKRLQQLLDLGASVQLACATWPTPVDAMLGSIDNPKGCKLPSCVPELIRAMVAAGCSISTQCRPSLGNMLAVDTIISWFTRLGSDTDWPPSLSASAVDVGCVLLDCLEAESLRGDRENSVNKGYLMWIILKTGSIQLAGEWGERHWRLVHHFCDMAEALLAAGCPPIKLSVTSRDRPALRGAEAISTSGRTVPGGGSPGCLRPALEPWNAPRLPSVFPRGSQSAAAGKSSWAKGGLPGVVLLVLTKAAHPATAWVPQLQPGLSEASAIAANRTFACEMGLNRHA